MLLACVCSYSVCTVFPHFTAMVGGLASGLSLGVHIMCTYMYMYINCTVHMYVYTCMYLHVSVCVFTSHGYGISFFFVNWLL